MQLFPAPSFASAWKLQPRIKSEVHYCTSKLALCLGQPGPFFNLWVHGQAAALLVRRLQPPQVCFKASRGCLVLLVGLFQINQQPQLNLKEGGETLRHYTLSF